MLLALFMALTMASWIYWIVAWWLARIFFSSAPAYHLNFAPPVSILKPVKGLDHQAYENFASFCQQDYPEYELLFAMADPTDEAVSVIDQLKQEYPQIQIRTLIAPDHGTNHKASLLHTLALQARHQVLVASDSDMRVTPDYLRRVVAPLSDPQVGLVTCPYKGENPSTFTARLEALHMGVTFLPSVLVGRRVLKMRFALGATVALRKKHLNQIGGFAAIADYLADDYQLGVRIANLGLRVHMSDYIVASILGATTFSEQWHREVRWAHCNRVSRPLEYPGILLSFSTPLAFTILLVSAFSTLGWWTLATSLTLRWTVGWLITGTTKDEEGRRWLFWLPIRDMLSALIWCAGFLSRRVIWRGEQFMLRSDGRLVSAESHRPAETSTPETSTHLRAAIKDLDAYLRHYYNIVDKKIRSRREISLNLRRLLFILLLIGFTALVVTRFANAQQLIHTLLHGIWHWVVIGVLLHILYFFLDAVLYKYSFATVGVESRAVELFPVVLSSIFVNAVAPTGGAGGAALFVDYTTRHNQSGPRTMVGIVLSLIADLSTLIPFIVWGVIFLNSYRNLKIYETIGFLFFVTFIILLAGILLLAHWKPHRLHQVSRWFQRAANRAGGWVKRPDLLSEEWAERTAGEFIEGANAISDHPKTFAITLFWGMVLHIVNLVGLYAFFLAYRQPVRLGTLVAGFSIGVVFFIVTVIPQGVGAVEGIMTLIFISMGIPKTNAATITLVFRGVNFWMPVVLGLFTMNWVTSSPPQEQAGDQQRLEDGTQ
jgi:ceramide glucosyltransferase